MDIRSLRVALAFLLASGAVATCAAQPPPADYQKQLDALRAQVTAMQKDLDEIKALLAPLRARQPPPPGSVSLDLGTRPVRGSQSARLTLVELTDYQ
jgi:hypothetical protein